MPAIALLLLLPLSSPILTKWSQARAQDVERSELPPLPGAAAPDLNQTQPSPPTTPDLAPPPPFAPAPSGPVSGTSPLPYDVWRGVDTAALERLLAAASLPSSSPALARLIARELNARTTGGHAVLSRHPRI